MHSFPSFQMIFLLPLCNQTRQLLGSCLIGYHFLYLVLGMEEANTHSAGGSNAKTLPLNRWQHVTKNFAVTNHMSHTHHLSMPIKSSNIFTKTTNGFPKTKPIRCNNQKEKGIGSDSVIYFSEPVNSANSTEFTGPI